MLELCEVAGKNFDGGVGGGGVVVGGKKILIVLMGLKLAYLGFGLSYLLT